MDERTDEEVLAAAVRDPEAFGVLYDRHVRTVLAYLYRRTACSELAADLAAETFAVAFVARRRFRPDKGVAIAWLLGIAQHQLARALRRGKVGERARRRLGIPRVEVDDESLARIEELADLSAIQAEVRAALGALSPKVAAAVRLRVGEDLPYAEVARRLGCTEGAARARTARGLARLAEILEATQ